MQAYIDACLARAKQCEALANAASDPGMHEHWIKIAAAHYAAARAAMQPTTH